MKERIRYQYAFITMLEKEGDVPVSNFVDGVIVVEKGEDPRKKFDSDSATEQTLKLPSVVPLLKRGYSAVSTGFAIMPIISHYVND